MAPVFTFRTRCETFFKGKMGFGQQWESACANALGLNTDTLRAYLDDELEVPDDVMRRLRLWEVGIHGTIDDLTLVVLFASACVVLQELLDERGGIRNAYPETLRRAFDIAAAKNHADGTRWPTDLTQLVERAATPLASWAGKMEWDPDGQYIAARLIEGGAVTPECRSLARYGRDPELEIEENEGYRLLMRICRGRRDGQVVYVAWRRFVIEHPVLLEFSHLLTHPILSTVERITDIYEAFYQRTPEAAARAGEVPLCLVTGTLLRPEGGRYSTESRDPEARRLASAGQARRVPWTPRMRNLKRAFRAFWCLPGQTEIRLADRLTAAGWKVDLWPDFDRVDISAVSPGGRRVAVDVKDHLSPENLAARFRGFNGFEGTHECRIVVPDYVVEIDSGFATRFEAIRATRAMVPVELRTVSRLLTELEVR